MATYSTSPNPSRNSLGTSRVCSHSLLAARVCGNALIRRAYSPSIRRFPMRSGREFSSLRRWCTRPRGRGEFGQMRCASYLRMRARRRWMFSCDAELATMTHEQLPQNRVCMPPNVLALFMRFDTPSSNSELRPPRMSSALVGQGARRLRPVCEFRDGCEAYIWCNEDRDGGLCDLWEFGVCWGSSGGTCVVGCSSCVGVAI